MIWLTAFGTTSRDTVREDNQDWMLVGRSLKNNGEYEVRFRLDDDYVCQWGWLAAVADGMGGHAAGSMAARLALEILDHHFFGVPKQGCQDLTLECLREGLERANHVILETGLKPEYAGLGSTVAGVAIIGGTCIPFHAGDSRVYRFRLGALRQLTQDDSIVSIAEQAGYLPRNPQLQDISHLITNGLGMRDMRLHTGSPFALQPGDILMISSDGLHGALTTEAIENILEEPIPLAERGRLLMGEALQTSTDNATLILLELGPTVDR